MHYDALHEKSLSLEKATPEFLEFSQNCNELYENPALGLRERAAIHMLFEKVLEKSKKHRAFMQSNVEKETNHPWGGSTYGDADRFFDQFSSSSTVIH